MIPICTMGFQNCDLFFDRVFTDEMEQIRGFKYFDHFAPVTTNVTDVLNGAAPAARTMSSASWCIITALPSMTWSLPPTSMAGPPFPTRRTATPGRNTSSDAVLAPCAPAWYTEKQFCFWQTSGKCIDFRRLRDMIVQNEKWEVFTMAMIGYVARVLTGVRFKKMNHDRRGAPEVRTEQRAHLLLICCGAPCGTAQGIMTTPCSAFYNMTGAQRDTSSPGCATRRSAIS